MAKGLASKFRARGIKVIVLDAVRDPSWPCDYITDNAQEFQGVVQASKRCMVFVDEAGSYLGHHDKQLHWLATKGRHWGHSVFVIAQRPMQISKLVRDQCRDLYLFQCGLSDAKMLADDWGQEALRQAPALPQFTCIHARHFFGCERLFVPLGLDKVSTI